jgi:hypothetical protein
MSEHLKCGALRRVLPGWYVTVQQWTSREGFPARS